MKKGLLILSLVLAPLNTLAYSSEVILGGKTIGIDVYSDGVLVVGFYKINGKYNEASTKILEGDYILKVNDVDVNSMNDLTHEIEKHTGESSVILTVRRENNTFNTTLDLKFDSNVYKTGLYIKDSITGIGTLTFIDPANMIYGALGHEIIESNTSSIVEIKTGTIFENNITSIDKSEPGEPGSKNATFNYDNTYGSVITNTNKGIYGDYSISIDNEQLIEVGNKDDIVVGPAIIYTVTNNQEIKTYDIYISSINNNSDTKNLSIEITDKELLKLTGGIVQGMSGSPIIQNDKLIGAVTHVLINSPNEGYGIFIENMLENSDSVYESFED